MSRSPTDFLHRNSTRVSVTATLIFYYLHSNALDIYFYKKLKIAKLLIETIDGSIVDEFKQYVTISHRSNNTIIY
jgi:hypothetical protein